VAAPVEIPLPDGLSLGARAPWSGVRDADSAPTISSLAGRSSNHSERSVWRLAAGRLKAQAKANDAGLPAYVEYVTQNAVQVNNAFVLALVSQSAIAIASSDFSA